MDHLCIDMDPSDMDSAHAASGPKSSDGRSVNFSCIIRGTPVPHTIGVRFRTRPNGEQLYSSFCMVPVSLQDGSHAQRWLSCGLYE